jgi:hypothetical protein
LILKMPLAIRNLSLNPCPWPDFIILKNQIAIFVGSLPHEFRLISLHGCQVLAAPDHFLGRRVAQIVDASWRPDASLSGEKPELGLGRLSAEVP